MKVTNIKFKNNQIWSFANKMMQARFLNVLTFLLRTIL